MSITRALLFLLLLPAVLAAQDTYVGLRAGRNVAQFEGDRTRSGPAVGVFALTSVSDHVGLEWGVDWMRSTVATFDRSSMAAPPPARPEYLTTDLVARLSAAHSFVDAFRITLGAAVFGGGWLGLRTGGDVGATDPRRFDFGQVWGASLFATHGRVRLEGGLQAYHGERDVWERGPRLKGSRVFMGVAYRVR